MMAPLVTSENGDIPSPRPRDAAKDCAPLPIVSRYILPEDCTHPKRKRFRRRRQVHRTLSKRDAGTVLSSVTCNFPGLFVGTGSTVYFYQQPSEISVFVAVVFPENDVTSHDAISFLLEIGSQREAVTQLGLLVLQCGNFPRVEGHRFDAPWKR
uniref:Uncharacterized protein n=1 Tax=Steinernema glaseri TaxID=37863 RepID=A0A1I7Y9K1_9BILA